MSSWSSCDQRGQSTAEYAIGVTGACAIAWLLGWCAGSGYAALLRQLLEIAVLLSHVPRFML